MPRLVRSAHLLPSLPEYDQTQPPVCDACITTDGATFGENTTIGTSRCAASLDRYGKQLNRASLKDAAAVNATRRALFERLKAFGVPVECGSGGLTKFNRTKRGLPKTHWLDAACVGKSTPESIQMEEVIPLIIEAKGHGNRQMGYPYAFGFPKRHRKRRKKHFGYQTGNFVRAVVPNGKYVGVHVDRVLARATGKFDIATSTGRVQGISYRYCHPLHQDDGYSYFLPEGLS